jgi:phosphodiesterase/alkaline phosphatase D-like protein
VGGVRPERERLLRFLQANVKNVVFLTTDTHGNLVNEVRYKTFGTPEGSGMWEVVTGPVATNTFAKEIDGYLGQRAPGRRSAHSSSSPPAERHGHALRCARHVQLLRGHRHRKAPDPSP